MKVKDYPRCYLLALQNMLLYPNLRNMKENHFMDLNVDCLPGTFKYPWYTFDLTAAPPADHDEGSGVHYVYYDAQQAPHEAIYHIGGETASGGAAGDDVDRLRDPSPTSANWDPASAIPELNTARKFLNAVIGATGEIFVLGGATGAQDDPVFVPERLQPEEAGYAPGGTWLDLAPHSKARTYHSVTFLLADGRIGHAGGEDPGAHHTLEIYHPDYMFLGPRPTVSNLGSSVWFNGSLQQTFDVTTRAGVTFDRAHLIRFGSTTHGFDSSQRFVGLRAQPPVQIGPNTYRITVLTPFDDAHAPPGYYMLFVVDSAGIPSVAEVVQVQ